ncbi:MAG TPA: GNAT family N-acetyltransferase [Limnochordales bacterium]
MGMGLLAGDARQERDTQAPAVRAWRTECTGWLALGRAPEARGIYQVAGHAGMVIVRPDQQAVQRLPAMILIADPWPGEPAERLAVALEMLGPVHEPIYVSLPPDALAGPWEAALAAFGFRCESTHLLMTCPLPRPEAERVVSRTAGLSLSLGVADADEDREAALAVVAEGFGDTPSVAAFYSPRGVVRQYLARVQGEPAATAALWPFAGVAGIYSVATRRRFRGRGLAYALIEHILHEAARLGFNLASLRTTHELESLYARHGFTISGYVRRYWRPR